MSQYQSKAAREAESSGYGRPSYWQYLDDHARELHAYHTRKGDLTSAERMLTRDLGEALRGNDGN